MADSLETGDHLTRAELHGTSAGMATDQGRGVERADRDVATVVLH
jgi:hypothetical protein